MIKQEASLYNSAAPWTTWRDFRITKKVVESSVITSFYFTPLDDMPLPRYKPGQYISISTCIPSLHHKQNRQYTLSDSPNKLHYRISVKRESPLDKNPNGIFSNMLHDTKNEGDILQLSHPFGDFYVDAEENADRAMVLISAGVGITPMLAILNSFICSQQPAAPPPRISFIHASRNSHSQAFASHIANVTASHDSITSSMFVKSPSENAIKGQDYHFQGRMDLGRLDRRVDLLLGDCQTRYYICGPAGFMRDMSVALCGFGVQESRVKLEIFGTGNLDQL
jgi:nitric oxide dioxygenase